MDFITSFVNNRSNKPYCYKPLRHATSFRILILTPSGNSVSPLRGELKDENLDNPTKYKAISYVWGSARLSHEIFINGKRLAITASCAAVLRNFRYPSDQNALWIDGICIDQSSISERNQQVALMGNVYHKASSVWIWLGQGNVNSDLAFKYIEKAASVPKESEEFPKLIHEIRSLDNAAGVTLRGTFLYEALGRAWFDRLWTFQEVALASGSIITCGRSLMPYEAFCDGIRHLEVYMMSNCTGVMSTRYLRQTMLSNLQLSVRYYRLVRQKNPRDRSVRQSLTHTLQATRLQSTTDPKDKVFALYSILETLDMPISPPDYAKETVEIYTATAGAAIQHDCSLDVICCVSGHCDIQGLPSWVPDWSIQTKLMVEYDDYCASPRDSLQLNPSPVSKCGNRLTLHGFIAGKVEAKVNPVLSEGSDPPVTLRPSDLHAMLLVVSSVKLSRKIVKLASARGRYPTGEEAAAALYCLLARRCDKNSDALEEAFARWYRIMSGKGEEYQHTIREGEKEIRRVYASVKKEHDADIMEVFDTLPVDRDLKLAWGMFLGDSPYVDAREFHWGFHLNINRPLAFFTTKDGYTGLAHPLIEVGDLVVLAEGAKMPLILREEQGLFMLVAPAIIHGMMHGRRWSNNEIELREFTLI